MKNLQYLEIVFEFHCHLCLRRMAAAARGPSAERPEPGFESMSHFVLDTEQLVVTLENMDFSSGDQNQNQNQGTLLEGEEDGREMKRL